MHYKHCIFLLYILLTCFDKWLMSDVYIIMLYSILTFFISKCLMADLRSRMFIYIYIYTHTHTHMYHYIKSKEIFQGSSLIHAEWNEVIQRFSMFHRAFFSSIIDKHQHMHFSTFKTVLV